LFGYLPYFSAVIEHDGVPIPTEPAPKPVPKGKKIAKKIIKPEEKEGLVEEKKTEAPRPKENNKVVEAKGDTDSNPGQSNKGEGSVRSSDASAKSETGGAISRMNSNGSVRSDGASLDVNAPSDRSSGGGDVSTRASTSIVSSVA